MVGLGPFIEARWGRVWIYNWRQSLPPLSQIPLVTKTSTRMTKTHKSLSSCCLNDRLGRGQRLALLWDYDCADCVIPKVEHFRTLQLAFRILHPSRLPLTQCSQCHAAWSNIHIKAKCSVVTSSDHLELQWGYAPSLSIVYISFSVKSGSGICLWNQREYWESNWDNAV